MRGDRSSWLISIVGIYPAWLAMMALHECGHILHAWLSGGDVQRVTIPLWGFSITEFGRNPHPAFVAWGGAVWGSLVPLAAIILIRLMKAPPVARRLAGFFAGFCLVTNGTYFLAAVVEPVGDAADLVRGGVPKHLLAAIGGAMLMGGLALWHRCAVPQSPAAPHADDSIS